MAKRGRPRKSTEAHKLDNTYQECRHKNNVDIIISDILNVPSEIETPQEIKDLSDKELELQFQNHIEMLIKLKSFYLPDLPELIHLYTVLAETKKIKKLVQTIDILKDEISFTQYHKLQSLYLKHVAIFNTLGSKFFITPQARTQMTIGNLQALNENLKLKEKQTQQNPIDKLVSKKKS